MSGRALILTILAIIYFAFICAVGTIVSHTLFDGADGFNDALQLVLHPRRWNPTSETFWQVVGSPAAMLVATQIAFLWPVLKRRPEQHSDGRPLWSSLIGAGVVGGALTAATIGAYIDAAAMIMSGGAPEDTYEHVLPNAAEQVEQYLPLIMVILSWAFWSLILWFFTQRHPPRGGLLRIIWILLGGTILELIIVIPIDIMVRRRADCYCGTASFAAMCASAWALFWLAGPGAFLALTSKRRRLFSETCCPACGHIKGPTPGATCPECGTAWSSPPRKSPPG